LALFVAAVAAFAQCGGGSPAAPSPTAVPSPHGTIRQPTAGQGIGTVSAVVSGDYEPANLSEEIWVFVFPDLAPGIGFPQSENRVAGVPARKQSGQWQVTATFGGPPQGYAIEAYSANTSASSIIATHLRSGSGGMARTAAPGVTSIPAGLTMLGSAVRVSRGPIATITDPGDGAVVTAGDIVVLGRYASDLNDNIWVLVWPELAPGLGYPQSPDAARGLPSTKDPQRLTWSVPVTLGGPPQTYDIRVYTADTAASNALGAILARQVATSTFAGLRRDELPLELHEQQKITIRKR
jgi:hypothetical protein